MDLLRSECENGLKYRYNTIPTEVKSRITKELDVIDKMNFALMQYHKYSLTELESMIPFEREIYVAMLVKYLEEEKQRLDAQRK